jgi:outer membrane protein OmpA-like peptidoglycan-associated protein
VGWDVVLCALGVVVLGWAVFAHGQGRPDALRQLAEGRINQALADAGHGWARLKVDDSVGVLVGTAPNPASRTALLDIAREVTEPYAGVPGVFLRLEDRTRVNEVLPPRPPAPPPEPEVDLLADLAAPGAGRVLEKLPAKGPSMYACSKAFQTVQETRPLRFRPGSASLERGTGVVVQQLAALAMQCKDWRLVVEAPLDGIGPRRGDVSLGERRAAVLAAALMVEGVPARQIEAVAQQPEVIEAALVHAYAASDAALAASAALADGGASAAAPAVRPAPRPASRNRVEFRLAALSAR